MTCLQKQLCVHLTLLGTSVKAARAPRYSNTEAQRADWRAGHKEECPTLVAWRSRHGVTAEAPVRMMAKAIWRRCSCLALHLLTSNPMQPYT